MLPTSAFEAYQDASKIYCHTGEQDDENEIAWTWYGGHAKSYVTPSQITNDILWQSDLLPVLPVATIVLILRQHLSSQQSQEFWD